MVKFKRKFLISYEMFVKQLGFNSICLPWKLTFPFFIYHLLFVWAIIIWKIWVVCFKWEILCTHNLWGSNKLVVPNINTATHGSTTMWNGLNDDLRSITPLNDFKSKVRQISFQQKYCCNMYLLFLGLCIS